ncbi:hypothetical protein [Streptomyces aureoverticillatus]|uniref:hypothetical protein n=1 Tax=Streptomyces aureoverticillatus TaxID=66871 RepID=UPI0013DA66EF|nr:hypothetical protein [Streptomyces aureoverticillatus]QIB47828.1 hypothetical protein G3H79_36925 [Streptomyces aureoverticillatus]
MSTALAVRLHLSRSPTGESNEAVIVGDILSADLRGESRRNILIPCGIDPRPTAYAVTPGRYLVSATLPSGLVLTEDAVAVEGEETPVDFAMTDSPYETHSWQYLMGNIESGRVYHSPAEVPLAQSVASRSMVAPAPTPRAAGPQADVDLTGLASWIGDASPENCTFASILALGDNPPDEPVARHIARGEPLVLPEPDVRGEAVSPLYRFGPIGPVGVVGDPPGHRQFLVVEAEGSVRLVTLPLPWGSSEVEVLVNLRQSPTGSAVAIAVRDPAIGAGLAYMSQGALDMAAQLFTDVEAMLYSKFQNPLAAAAGAYVLIGTDHTRGETYWDPWLERLADSFPWISDGAILRAIRALRRASPDLRRARDGLIEAFDRGIPFYTLGLVWLVDGLSAFPDDPECVRRLDEVRRLSWLTDMRQPFLILDLRQGSA